MLRSRSVEGMEAVGTEEAEDSTAAVQVHFTAGAEGFTAVVADFGVAEDSVEDRVDSAEEDLAGVAGSAEGRAGAGSAADGHLAATEDLAEGRSAADLGREDSVARIADLAVDARAWDGVSEAWAAVLETGGLRALPGRLRMGDGMGSEMAGALKVVCARAAGLETWRLPTGDGIRLEALVRLREAGEFGISRGLTLAAIVLWATGFSSVTTTSTISEGSTASDFAGRSLALASALEAGD